MLEMLISKNIHYIYIHTYIALLHTKVRLFAYVFDYLNFSLFLIIDVFLLR